MATVAGIAFRMAGKIYYFDPGPLQIYYNQKVVVETSRGLELGTVKVLPREVPEEELTLPLKNVLRISTGEDELKYLELQEQAKEAKSKALERVQANNLPMRLVGGEYTFDEKKLIIYFTAESRVDFRQLVKELAGIFKIRIELQQIGARDESKMVGALASCGRETCCSLFLRDMPPITTKMVKEQNLPLNPQKNAGMCGKLKCCLRYEYEVYREIKKVLPKIGSEVVFTDFGLGLVVGQNILRRTLIVQKMPDNVRIEVPASDVRVVKEGKDTQGEEQHTPNGNTNENAPEQKEVEVLVSETKEAEN